MAGRPTIVVGFKNSEVGKHALATSVDLAQRLDARVKVVHVITHEDYRFDPDSPDLEFEGWRRLGEIREEAERLLATCPDSRFIERRGHPAPVLRKIADGCGALMIVVGLPHRGMNVWVPTLLSRRVSRTVTRSPTRPVLLVPLPRRREGASR